MESITSISMSQKQRHSTNQRVCICNRCIDDQEQHFLTCKICEKRFHFRCTQLPGYQIQLFLKGRTPKYVCQSCTPVTKEIDEDLLDPSVSRKEIEQLKKELQERDTQVKHILESYKRLEKSNKELESLIEKLQNTPGYHTVEFVEKKMEKKLEEIKTCIIEKIENTSKTTEKQIEEKIKSYATVASSTENEKYNINDDSSLREVVKSVRKAEIIEDRDRKTRSNNIIIHGVLESDEENHDQSFVTDLSKDVQASIIIKHIARLGKLNEGKIVD